MIYEKALVVDMLRNCRLGAVADKAVTGDCWTGSQSKLKCMDSLGTVRRLLCLIWVTNKNCSSQHGHREIVIRIGSMRGTILSRGTLLMVLLKRKQHE